MAKEWWKITDPDDFDPDVYWKDNTVAARLHEVIVNCIRLTPKEIGVGLTEGKIKCVAVVNGRICRETGRVLPLATAYMLVLTTFKRNGWTLGSIPCAKDI